MNHVCGVTHGTERGNRHVETFLCEANHGAFEQLLQWGCCVVRLMAAMYSDFAGNLEQRDEGVKSYVQLQGAGIFRNGMSGDVTNIFFENNDAALNGGGLYMVCNRCLNLSACSLQSVSLLGSDVAT